MKVIGPENCLSCGKCLPQCPSYRLYLQENFSPRGRNFLLSKGIYTPSLDFCLFCERCSKICPQGISFPKAYLIKKTRENKPPIPHPHDSLYLLKFLSLNQNIIKDFKEEILQNFKEGDFYIYLSCGLKHLYPEAFFKFLGLLKREFLRPCTPSGQGCCGIPYLSFGYIDVVRDYAKNILQKFAEPKPVVTFCATCFWVLKRVYPLLFAEEKEGEAFKELSQRCYFVFDFLKIFLQKNIELENKKEILYHFPCHLNFPLTSEEKNLKNILGAKDFCCGSAKLFLWLRGFQREYAKLWKGELMGKLYLATLCTGCYLNFSFLLREPPKIMHWLEFLL